jgi:hypothetical protein
MDDQWLLVIRDMEARRALGIESSRANDRRKGFFAGRLRRSSGLGRLPQKRNRKKEKAMSDGKAVDVSFSTAADVEAAATCPICEGAGSVTAELELVPTTGGSPAKKPKLQNVSVTFVKKHRWQHRWHNSGIHRLSPEAFRLLAFDVMRAAYGRSLGYQIRKQK